MKSLKIRRGASSNALITFYITKPASMEIFLATITTASRIINLTHEIPV